MIPVVGEHLGLLEFAAWLYMIWYLFRAMRNVLRPAPRASRSRSTSRIGFAYICAGVDGAAAHRHLQRHDARVMSASLARRFTRT